MSEKIDIIIDSSTDVEARDKIVSASSDNNVDVEILEPDYDITINKKEYIITGDNLYIPKSYEESPQWLKDIIGTITDFTLNQKLTEIGALSNTLYGLIEELQVAKNTYTQSIISSADIDERINARIETLNSSIADSDATIVDLIATKATPTEASSLALNVLTASINDGAISSLVSNLQNAISTTNSTLSNNIDIVHSEMIGDFEANAEVINAIETNITNIDGTLTTHARQITSLQTQADSVDGKIATASSSITNTLNTTISNGDIAVESKFGYNSNITIAGVPYSSGFGIATSVNSPGHGIPSGDSQFWINASKFKFTNSNQTGSKAPFSIDASGVTPEIYFNGKVSFSNVTGYTPPDVSGNINANNDVFAQKLGYANYVAMVNAASSGHTIINGGYINTSLIQANAINADMINSNSALINKLNVTGGIVSNNIVVPGINGNNPLFSASGDKVVINNLKVLGTVSMPGISKGGNFSVPNLAVGSSHTVIVDKPYECNSWSLTAIVSLSNITGNGNTTNFGCRLYINGVQVSASHGVSTWAINVSTTGTLGGLVASQIPISINTSGFGDASGAFSGSISYIAIVEN